MKAREFLYDVEKPAAAGCARAKQLEQKGLTPGSDGRAGRR